MTREPNILTRYIALREGFGGADPRTWLTAAEQGELARFRDPVRRRQWLAGRWVGKQLVGEACDVAMAGVQILSRDRRGLGSRPHVHVGSRTLDWSVSLAHTERGVLVALVTTDELLVGVDLMAGVPCDRRFLELWFTAEERRWIGGEPRRAAIVWSVKEAVYKACHVGQGWSPRLVEVSPRAGEQFACTFDGQPVERLQLEISDVDGQVATVATVAAAATVNVDVSPFEATYSTEFPLASCS